MNIGVDVHIAAKENRRGVPHYVIQVVSRLITAWPDDDWQLLHVGADWHGLPPVFRTYAGLTTIERGRVVTNATNALRRRSHDHVLRHPAALFIPALGPLTFDRCVPKVLTIHDVLHVTHAAVVRGHQRGVRHRAWSALVAPRRQIEGADILLANSKHTRDGLLRHTDVSEGRIRVVPHGVDDEYFAPCPEFELTEVLGRHGLAAGYILYLGTIESRKNVGALLRGFSQLRRRRPSAVLVLAGQMGAGARKELESGIDGVRLLGRVRDDDKRALYTGAAVYCSMSHEEGLGLTPLEALACGTPSVVSSIPAHRESLGSHCAQYVDDRCDPVAIATALERVLDDAAARRVIGENASAILAEYRWDACASQTYAALRDAAQASAWSGRR